MGAGFKDFASGAILTAGDVDNYLMRQTVMTFADASARDTALSAVLDEGMTAYLEDTDTVTVYDGSAWNAIGGGGKILQVVRATDATARNTTSTSFVDASISVTITPTSASSNILLVWAAGVAAAGGQYNNIYLQITDNSNVQISAGQQRYGQTGNTNNQAGAVVVAWDSPATTSATTYKGRFRAEQTGSPTPTVYLDNASFGPAQLFAIEVGA